MKFFFILFLFIAVSNIGLADDGDGEQEQAPQMRFGNFGDFAIVGDEYWEFVDGEPHPQATVDGVPKAGIIWDYNQANERSQACAIRGNQQLVGWLENSESRVYQALERFRDAGGNPRFFAWTNNFIEGRNYYQNGIWKGQQIRLRRRPRVWYWEESLLKYESTILPNGQCRIPRENQVVWMINRESQRLEVAQAAAEAQQAAQAQSSPSSVGEQGETPQNAQVATFAAFNFDLGQTPQFDSSDIGQ